MVKQIKTPAELDAIFAEAGGKLILIDFFATWCGPCRAISPFIEELEKLHQDVVFVKIDVDESEELAAKYKVNVMPTFIFIKNKEKVGEMAGANKDKLKETLEEKKK